MVPQDGCAEQHQIRQQKWGGPSGCKTNRPEAPLDCSGRWWQYRREQNGCLIRQHNGGGQVQHEWQHRGTTGQLARRHSRTPGRRKGLTAHLFGWQD